MRRILTAIVLIPLAVCLIVWGPAYLLAGVALVICEFGLWEFLRLAEARGSTVVRVPAYAFSAAIVAASLAPSIPVCLVGAIILFLLVLLTWAMGAQQELAAYLGSVSSTFLGVLYIAVPLSLLIWLCLRPGGRMLALFGLILVWTGDTAAFLVGRPWGKHKFSPRISPGKTWEGAAASMAAAILAGILFEQFFWRGTGRLEAAALAVLVNAAAQIGDLVESALKRSAGVKDSSQLVPGHGGVLDRIDAVLFAAPVLWYYWLWKVP